MNALALHRILAIVVALGCGAAIASEGEAPVARTYAKQAPAPERQTVEEAAQKSLGCETCHTATDHRTMHVNAGVILGCTDCHGGNVTIRKPEGTSAGDAAYKNAEESAHILPRYPMAWKYPSSANPQESYTLLNREAKEFVRFVNPGDYRVARDACGACHLNIIVAAERSLMSTSAMLWGGASYNNGILPFKRYILGEAYTPDGIGATVVNPVPPTELMTAKGILP